MGCVKLRGYNVGYEPRRNIGVHPEKNNKIQLSCLSSNSLVVDICVFVVRLRPWCIRGRTALYWSF